MILTPTDFSDNANHAIDYAIALAKQIKDKILLVNAYLIPVAETTYPPAFIGDEIKRAEFSSNHHLKMRCASITAEDGVSCNYISEFGEPTKVILDIISKIKPSLVVMGTHGATGLKAMFVGSNTSQVIAKSEAPVIAVPALSKFRELKRIIYTTDFHKSDIRVLEYLLKLFGNYQPHIQITHIYDGDFLESQQNELSEFKKKVADKISYQDLSFKLLHVQNVLHELGTLSRSKNYDLLVMSNHPRSLFDRFINRSMTKAIALKTEIPLLVMHHIEESVVVS